MSRHSHDFVETYDGLVGFGLDRATDENTVMCYLQKFSDDTLLRHLVNRMTDDELTEIFSLMGRLLRTHMEESEYHRLFLKEDAGPHEVSTPMRPEPSERRRPSE